MTPNEWGERVFRWKKKANLKKSLDFHLMHLVSEAGEAWEELRKHPNRPDLIYYEDHKPEGFGIELADIVLTALYIARRERIDIEACMKMKMEHNEDRRPANDGMRER